MAYFFGYILRINRLSPPDSVVLLGVPTPPMISSGGKP